MYYKIYQDSARQWRWNLRAANHLIVADSAEAYHNKADCLHGIELVKGSYNAPIYE